MHCSIQQGSVDKPAEVTLLSYLLQEVADRLEKYSDLCSITLVSHTWLPMKMADGKNFYGHAYIINYFQCNPSIARYIAVHT